MIGHPGDRERAADHAADVYESTPERDEWGLPCPSRTPTRVTRRFVVAFDVTGEDSWDVLRDTARRVASCLTPKLLARMTPSGEADITHPIAILDDDGVIGWAGWTDPGDQMPVPGGGR